MSIHEHIGAAESCLRMLAGRRYTVAEQARIIETAQEQLREIARLAEAMSLEHLAEARGRG